MKSPNLKENEMRYLQDDPDKFYLSGLIRIEILVLGLDMYILDQSIRR
jgi:hypothetical protein